MTWAGTQRHLLRRAPSFVQCSAFAVSKFFIIFKQGPYIFLCTRLQNLNGQPYPEAAEGLRSAGQAVRGIWEKQGGHVGGAGRMQL